MRFITFPGGIHPEYNKDISIRELLRRAPLPEKAIIPLSQHIGRPNEPLVKKGDHVEEGQVVGQSSSFISSPVHSPVYGTVSDVRKEFHPALGPVLSVVIERDKEKPQKNYPGCDSDDISNEELIRKVRDAGIVGMGGAAFPTHVKLTIPEGKKIETLIVNGAECEPFLTCDHMLMTKKTIEILKGIALVINVLRPRKTYIAIENNKRAAFFAFQKLIAASKQKEISKIELIMLKTKYPQGGEKQLIKAIAGREVPPDKLPLDIGFLVQNVGTIFAIYEAVYFNKPLMERIITISGDCLERPGNYVMKVGTTIKEIVEKHGINLSRDPKKVIVGGPMMGFAQPGMETPVLKSTSGILFLSGEYIKDLEETQCIRCAKCIDVCPVNLSPTEIVKNVKKGYWDKMEDLWVSDCIECGACAYSCPARIPLVQYIKEGKTALLKKKT